MSPLAERIIASLSTEGGIPYPRDQWSTCIDEVLRQAVHDTCHDLHLTGPVTAREFCDGCERFQTEHYGHSPTNDGSETVSARASCALQAAVDADLRP